MKKEIIIKMEGADGSMPIAKLVALANSFNSQIYIIKDGIKVNAKSIMGMMNLMWTSGHSVVLDVQGEDEQTAIEQIESFLVKSNL